MRKAGITLTSPALYLEKPVLIKLGDFATYLYLTGKPDICPFSFEELVVEAAAWYCQGQSHEQRPWYQFIWNVPMKQILLVLYFRTTTSSFEFRGYKTVKNKQSAMIVC